MRTAYSRPIRIIRACFKKLSPFEDFWSVRINNDYRAVGRWRDDVILWFFIGSHADYDKLLARRLQGP